MTRASLRTLATCISTLALALGLASCSALSDSSNSNTASSPSEGSQLSVAASFYPIEFLAQKIGGDAISVSSVTPVNVEPHDFELSPKDVTALSKDNLVLYVSGFQPSLDDALKEVQGPTVIDLLDNVQLEHHDGVEDEHEHGEEGHSDEGHDEAHEDAEALDPHFWLDPVRMLEAGKAIEKALAEASPSHAEDFAANLAALEKDLNALNDDYTQGLAQCQRTTFVTGHSAFGYLAQRYHLTQESIAGLDPEAEPSPADIAAIKKVVQDTGTTTIFTEELVSPATAEAVAKETGATTEVLSPLESQPDDGDYTSAMTDNLGKLRKALGCN